MSSYAVGVTGYVLLLLILVALIVFSHRDERHVATGGRLLLSIRRSRFGRIAIVLAWWWVGWHLFVR